MIPKAPWKGLKSEQKQLNNEGTNNPTLICQVLLEWNHLEHISSNDKHFICQQMRTFQLELSEQMSAQHETDKSALRRPGNRSLPEQMSSNKFAEQVKMCLVQQVVFGNNWRRAKWNPKLERLCSTLACVTSAITLKLYFKSTTFWWNSNLHILQIYQLWTYLASVTKSQQKSSRVITLKA